MPDMDDLLQEKLEAIEKGTPVEDVLRGLPKEAEDLSSLIALAGAVRTLPHPELSPAQASALQQRVLAAAQAHTQPSKPAGVPGDTPTPTQPQPAAPPLPVEQQPRPPEPARSPKRQTRWIDPRWNPARSWVIPAMAGLAALLAVCVFLAAGIGFWFSGPTAAKAATLMDVNGYVEVQAPNGSWTVAQEGQQVRQGDRVRTSGASSATLLFYEGSRASLGPNTNLVLKTVAGQWGSGLKVDLVQVSGKTDNSVVPLRGKNSQYLVEAPGGTASVHGTKFNVAVVNGGDSLFAVHTGKVEVVNPKSRVFVTAGQVTSVDPGQVAEAPAYQFTLDGTLASVDGSTWTVAGTPFQLTAATVISGQPNLGDDIHVEGRIQSTGAWAADTVDRANVSEPGASFSGLVEQMGSQSWVVGGVTLKITGQTQIDPNLRQGDAVQVVYRIAGPNWIALSISSLSETPGSQKPTKTPTPIPGAKPDLQFSPEETQLSSCEASFSIPGGLANQGEQSDDVASNVELGYTIDMGQQFVQSVSISPDASDTIDPGKTMPFSVSLELNQQAWDQATARKVVKLRIFVAHETNRPDHLKSRMTITIDGGDCKPTETPEDTETATPEASETPEQGKTPKPGETPPGTLEGVCTGANPQPTGMKLAERYGVDYATIMHYFCDDHLGFGEIEMGYGLSLQTGVPADQIFQMRLNGEGWGQIKQELLPKNNPPKATEAPQPKEKPTKKDKSSKP